MDSHPSASTTALCLACSASLPPRRTQTPSGSSGRGLEDDIFFTPCCGRPICPSCLSSNPRLRRYNPCLHCLGGVGVVGSSARLSPQRPPVYRDASASPPPQNIDGGVHDEDVFVLGDEDDEDDETSSPLPTSVAREDSPSESSCEPSTRHSTPPPPYTLESPSAPVSSESAHILEDVGDSAENLDSKPSKATAPVKYYIKPGDTLLGISLRYDIDVSYSFRSNVINVIFLLSIRVVYCVV